MYQATENYLNAAHQMTRQTSSKIKIDGVEYVNELISHPLISIENSSLIGGFPAKKVTFEMYKIDGLSIAGKEITVYRGMYIDDENIEYIPQGIFTAKSDDITVNEFGNKICVTAYDRAVLFNVSQQVQPSLTDTFTYGDYIRFILSDMAIDISSDNYPLKDTVMSSLPNVSENITKRELLSKFAEIIGAICIIDRSGSLSFVRQQESGLTYSDNYNRFILSEDIKVINQLCVSTQDINDDMVFPDVSEKAVQYRLISNPFCSSAQEEMIKLISPNIIGLTMAKFTMSDAIDDYIVDINDVITVHTSKGNIYKIPVLSYVSTGRIKADVGADIIDNNNTGLENSLSARIKNAEIQIDKQNGIIQLKVSENDLCSLIEQHANNIKFKANKLVFESENFAVDEEGNARLTGTVNAKYGIIGGFDIGTWDYSDFDDKVADGMRKTFEFTDEEGNNYHRTFAITSTSGNSDDSKKFIIQLYISDEYGKVIPSEYLFAVTTDGGIRCNGISSSSLSCNKIFIDDPITKDIYVEGNFKVDGIIKYADDNGWKPVEFGNHFQNYSENQRLEYRKNGSMVEIRGAAKPKYSLTFGSTNDKYDIGYLPAEYAPKKQFNKLCQGSGIAIWTLTVDSNGTISISRYRNENGLKDLSSSTWLPMQEMYLLN